VVEKSNQTTTLRRCWRTYTSPYVYLNA